MTRPSSNSTSSSPNSTSSPTPADLHNLTLLPLYTNLHTWLVTAKSAQLLYFSNNSQILDNPLRDASTSALASHPQSSSQPTTPLPSDLSTLHWYYTTYVQPPNPPTKLYASTSGCTVWLLLSPFINYSLQLTTPAVASAFCFALLKEIRTQRDLALVQKVSGGHGLVGVSFMSADVYNRVAASIAPAQHSRFRPAAVVLQRWFRGTLKKPSSQQQLLKKKKKKQLARNKRLRRAAVVIQHFWRRVLAKSHAVKIMRLKRALHARDALVLGLSREIIDFASCTNATVARQFILVNALVEHIRATCFSIRPDIQVELYGSMSTGLALPSSDVDLVCFADPKELEVIAKHLSSFVEARLVGNPPVLKFSTLVNGVPLKVDLSAASPTHTGLQASHFVRRSLVQFHLLGPVMLVIKQFLFERGLGQVYSGGLSSHAVFVMLLAVRGMIAPDANAGELLIKFLTTFAEHGFFQRNGVSASAGIFPLASLEERQPEMLPPAFIQDPIRTGNNLGAGSFRIRQVQLAFSDAVEALQVMGLQGLVQQAPWWR